jgi:predicted phage gp36 major capsid-like protein
MLTNHDKANIGEIIADRHGDWFTAHLLRLIKKADFENRARLSLIYPEEVQAVFEWENRDHD